MNSLLQAMRAAAEPTRLRLLALCCDTDLTVSDLTAILGQSQPRVSRHLKLLVEAKLLQRFREGTWAYYGRAVEGEGSAIAEALVGLIPDGEEPFALDRARLTEVKQDRERQANAYFSRNANAWREVRRLHIDESDVEAALIEVLQPRSSDVVADLGTGTGRVLEVIGPLVARAVGIDSSRDMLSVARMNLEHAGLRNCSVRLGDMQQAPLESAQFDAVIVHLALHYAERPSLVVAEAARLLKPGGRLVVVDFETHDEESLRDAHRHRWLGFSEEQVSRWFERAGLAGGTTVFLAGKPLTVCLWSAARLGDAAANSSAAEPARRAS